MNDTEHPQERRNFRIVCRPQNLLGATPLVKVELLWPCDAWDVTFPTKSQLTLDIFADTVLKLAHYGVTPKAESYPLGIKPELLRLVRENLVMQGLLDAQLHVTTEGKRYLGEYDGKEAAYETGTVFTDCCSGQLLPFVLNGQPGYSKGCLDNEGWMSYKTSPTDARTLRARVFEPSRPLLEYERPSSADVYRVLKLHRRTCSRIRIQENSPLAPPEIPAVGTVTVGKCPERIYLACTLLVPAGNVQETLVTDGFGLGFSAAFGNAIKRENPEWWREERRKSVVAKPLTPASCQATERLLYPKVTKLLRSVKHNYDKLTQQQEVGTDAAIKCQDAVAAVVGGAYDAIEHALAYYVVAHVPDAMVDLLQEMAMQAKSQHVLNCAKNLGLDTAPAKTFFDRLPPGKYKALRRGTAEMAPLLSLAIASGEADRTLPMARLADKEPALLARIVRLASLRNAAKHSAGEMPLQRLGVEDRKSQERAVDGIRRFALQVTCTLLPDIIPELGRDEVKDDSELTDVLASHLFLEEKFPFGFSDGLPRQMWDCLQAVARSWVSLNKEPENPQRQNTYVVNLCSSVEKMLEHACRGYDSKPAPDTGAAVRRMVETGFYPNPDAVPLGALGGHNNSHLARFLDGGAGTLGSCAMSLFLLARQEELEQLHRAVPDAVDQIVRICELRGHGNNSEGLQSKDLQSLNMTIYPLMRELGQIFIIS